MGSPLTRWGSHKLQGASSRAMRRESGSWHGIVRTPLGIVAVRSWSDWTYYETVVDGVAHSAKEDRGRTETGLAIVAHRWIKSLARPDSGGTE